MAIAQSQTTVSPSPSQGNDQYTGWPLSIGGTIYDADRRPVSGAIVTLYQNGRIVNRSSDGTTANLYAGPYQNPIISSYYDPENYDSEGFYVFNGLYPGIYEVKVEKGVYNTSTMIDANISKAVYHGSISLDIWLDDYHGTIWTQEQLSRTGAISGTVFDRNGNALQHPLITLMQNGQAMDIPHNPRYTYFNGTFGFKYLLPGQYQVVAEAEGHVSLPVSVSVQNGTSHANIVVQDFDINMTPYPQMPYMTPRPSPSFSATPPVTPHPTPSAGILAIIISMVSATAFVRKFQK